MSNDHLRRQAAESQMAHTSTMRSMRDLVDRLFGNTNESGFAKADFATGGLDRRRFMQVGGLTVATAAVFAACGTADSAPSTATMGEGANGAPGDLQILRTASSLEILAVDVYQKAIDSGLVKTAAVGDVAKLFQAQHREHAELFQGATERLGGQAFDRANPVVLQSLQGPIGALDDEMGVLELALMLEQAAAATYQSTVGGFDDASLNQAAMSVGGVEARHVAVLSSVLGKPPVPRAFQTTDGAVPAGTGV